MHLRQRTAYRGDDGELYKTVRPPQSSVKVWKDETDDGVEATFVRVPISSTSEDRDGDEFTEDGLEHMIQQLQSGDVPMFMDHGISPETGMQDYRALEAVGGWKDGEIEDGVVYGIGALDPEHDAAGDLESRLENGIVPVGWSVGFIPQETEPKTDDDGERQGERFLEHDLLEVSSVGIPSNPDTVSASIAQAAKSFAHTRGVDLDADTVADRMTEQLEQAIDQRASAALERVSDALDEYELEHGEDERSLEGFVEWATETDDHDADVVEGVVARYSAAVDDSDDPDPGLRSWLNEQRDATPDETDGSDGDDEDDEDEEEESAGGEPATLSDDSVESIAESVGDAVGRELEQHREIMLEELRESDDDEDDEDEEEETATTSSTAEPRGMSPFAGSLDGASGDDGSGEEQRDGGDPDDEGEPADKEGTPGPLRFDPGTETET